MSIPSSAADPYAGPDGEAPPEKFHEELERALVEQTEKVVGRMVAPEEFAEKVTRTKYNNGYVVYRWQDADLLYVRATWTWFSYETRKRQFLWEFLKP